MTLRDDQHSRSSQPTDAGTPPRAWIVPFAAGAAGTLLLLFTYHARTWQSLASAVAVCPKQFCDFVDYYYPMGEAIFRTGLPVRGFLYSPFVAILLAAFPPLGLSASLVLWGILQVASVSLSVLLFRRLVPAGLSIQLLFAALTLSSYPLLLNVMGGQVSVFIASALLGLLLMNERRHPAAAAGLLAFAVSFKFYPMIFIAPFAARRDTRFLLFMAAACGTALVVVPGLLLGAGDTVRFYGALLDAFRASGWVVTNPHSQFLPHVVLRLAAGAGHDVSAHLSLLHWIAYGVAAANLGLLFLVQRAHVGHADLWSFQLLFLTIPFVLTTSWPHDFVFLPLTQALLAWHLLEGENAAQGTPAVWRRSDAGARGERPQHAGRTVTLILLLLSIVLSNSVFFNLVGSFPVYGFLGFLFWADLLLLIACYVALLPPALRPLRGKHVKNGHDALMNHPGVAGTLFREDGAMRAGKGRWQPNWRAI